MKMYKVEFKDYWDQHKDRKEVWIKANSREDAKDAVERQVRRVWGNSSYIMVNASLVKGQ